MIALSLAGLFLIAPATSLGSLERIGIAKDQRGFRMVPSGKAFYPWGFNYDHDAQGRLLEDYWETEWDAVERDFRSMRTLGANTVRIHLQFGRFMTSPEQPNQASLARLKKLITLAERERLYLNLTGLGCYHKADVPEWYDKLTEAGRWKAQGIFWQAVAKACAKSPAVFCFNLMNEPVVPGGKREPGAWLGPGFGGKHFVQFITLDSAKRPRPEVAREWVRTLRTAIREVDDQTLITVGLVDWSLDRPGLTSGFLPDVIGKELDYISVHIYPEKGKVEDAVVTLKGFQIGKPVVVEETFPLKSSRAELVKFIEASEPHAQGWYSFFWGKTPEDLKASTTIGDAIQRDWLTEFTKLAPRMTQRP